MVVVWGYRWCIRPFLDTLSSISMLPTFEEAPTWSIREMASVTLSRSDVTLCHGVVGWVTLWSGGSGLVTLGTIRRPTVAERPKDVVLVLYPNWYDPIRLRSHSYI